jgi:hypothetical protein
MQTRAPAARARVRRADTKTSEPRPQQARRGPSLRRSHWGESGRVAPCLPREGGPGRCRGRCPPQNESRTARRRWIQLGGEGEVSNDASGVAESSACSCMQKPRRMRHQHGVQRAACATSRARRPRISPSFLAHSGDVLDQRRELARAQGALSRAERRFPTWPIGDDGRVPRLPDCFRTPPKFGVGASSVSRALAKQDEAPLRNGGLCRLRVLTGERG